MEEKSRKNEEKHKIARAKKIQKCQYKENEKNGGKVKKKSGRKQQQKRFLKKTKKVEEEPKKFRMKNNFTYKKME